MSLSSSRLAGSIKSAIETYFGAPSNDAKLTEFCNALASSIVTEIQNNAVVNPGTFSAAGSPVSGAGTII